MKFDISKFKIDFEALKNKFNKKSDEEEKDKKEEGEKESKKNGNGKNIKKISPPKIDLSKFKSLFVKYDYNINEVIGIDKEKLENNQYKETAYILYADRKLIRYYRGNLRAAPLMNGYIPIEDAMPFNFQVEKSVIEKLTKEEIKEYIETQVYESGGLKEEEEYEIKYTLIEDEEDEGIYKVETVVVARSAIEYKFRDLLERVGYIDYISFPAFSYKSLYEAEILKKANDLFIVLLGDKIFLTFYSNGNLQKILTINGGTDNIYEVLNSNLKIKNFNKKLFFQLLKTKGLSKSKYKESEMKVYETLRQEFIKLFHSINVEGLDLDIDRIFITTKQGNVENLANIISLQSSKEVFDFQFYEDYNLDRLPINPFLFLSMLEAHIAYKTNNQDYNFSLFLRPPTFFYRPSGQITLTFIISLILSAAYPLYLYMQAKNYQEKNKVLMKEEQSLSFKLNGLKAQLSKLEKQGKDLKNKKEILLKSNKENRNFINEIYNFKYSYKPVSKTLFEITKIINKNDVILDRMEYQKGVYVFKVSADYDFQIPNLIYDFNLHKFKVYTDKIVRTPTGYTSIIRITQ